ncbi:uncharacterized protein LOC136079998 [Hydra vulgaris]|uniref:Uncharacterized protein LOC136079998 n=1 Tax=Hydra vulgaris TaxID=6087 RepID=A0ABM4BU63_HYDVU
MNFRVLSILIWNHFNLILYSRETWAEFNHTCPGIYWTKFIDAQTNFSCNNKGIANTVWSGWSFCNTTCGNEVIYRTQLYCSFLNKSVSFCGDSLYMFHIMAEQASNLISALNNFYDQFEVAFDFYIGKTNFDEGNIFQLSNNSSGEVYIFFQLLGKSFGEIYDGFFASKLSGTKIIVSSFILTANTWSAVKISQHYFNGYYYQNITVNDTVVFSDNQVRPNVLYNVDIHACYGFCQPSSIMNLFITSKTQVYWLPWSSWSSCTTSNVLNRTRSCNSNHWLNCTGNSIEIQTCKLWKVSNTVTINRNLVYLSLQISPNFQIPSNVNVEFEYLLSPLFSFESNNVIQGFDKTEANRLKYKFNGSLTKADFFKYNFTASFNDSLCPKPGMITLEIPLNLSLQVDIGKRLALTKTTQTAVECFNIPKIPVEENKQVLKESYGRGIYWDADNSHIYVCMNQHVPSDINACYYSGNNGDSWDNIDVRIGSIIGHHLMTNELYGTHRNCKVYMVFNKVYRKWLAITNQQFKETLSSNFNTSVRKNLEGDYNQIAYLGPYQWLGNAEGLFFRKQVNDSWIKRVNWRV